VRTAWRQALRLLIALGLHTVAPRAALACPVCFGASDSLMATGMNNGVLALLAVTLIVLASFAAFFVYLMRRAKAFEGGNG
jgi:hypothetical protein